MAEYHFDKWLREKRGDMPQSRLAELAGTKKQTISSIERQQPHPTSGAPYRPTVEMVDKLATALNQPRSEARHAAGFTAPDEVITSLAGHRAAYYVDTLPLDKQDDALLYLEALSKRYGVRDRVDSNSRVPAVISLKISGRISAGRPIEAIEESDQEEVYVLESEVAGFEKRFALCVVGDSMRDAGVFNGDIIIVAESGDYINRIVVAKIGDDATLKRWRQKDSKTVVLEPANEDLDPHTRKKLYKPILLSRDKVEPHAVLIKVLRTVKPPQEQHVRRTA